MKKITYASAGDNYNTKDPIKKLAQKSAKLTSQNLRLHGFYEEEASRGESAYVFRQNKQLFASVVEGLGTKNLIADEMNKITGKTYYENIGHDTVATIINDLVSVGARPLVVNAYWAIGDNAWLSDKKRMMDLIKGFKKACDLSLASWGGGETPTLKGIINSDAIDLGGAAFGIIGPRKKFLTDEKISQADRIVLLKSSGVNANGASLIRAIAKKLPKGFETRLSNKKMFGEEVLAKTNIYAKVIKDLLENGIALHYTSNITGHGLRKIMRGRPAFTYIIEKIISPSPLFIFLQKQSGLSDYEMYETFNMGMDYALFLPKKDVSKTMQIIKKNGFSSMDAGYVQEGERQVVIEPLNITYKGKTLNLR